MTPSKIKHLVFGDIIENEYASIDNPTRIGVVSKLKEKTIICTDMLGNYWEVAIGDAKHISCVGTVLKDGALLLVKQLK